MDHPTDSENGLLRTTERRGLQFTLGELLLTVAGVSIVLSTYLTFGWLAASAAVLVLGVVLLVSGIRRKNRLRGCLGLAIALPAMLLCGLLLVGWLFLGIGPIYSQEAWPYHLKEMVKMAGENPPGVIVEESFCGIIDSEYTWRLSVKPDKIDAVVSHFGLVPVPEANVPSEFRQAFPRRWHPTATKGNQFWSTPQFPIGTRGSDGEHLFMMYDVQNKRLYVWNKSNF